MSSDEIQEKTCQLIAKSRIHPDCLLMSSDVFRTPDLSSESIVPCDEQKLVDNQGLASLLRKALNKLENSGEYDGVVEDIPAFVDVFNERDLEYKLRLGQRALLYNAEKQMARGWKL